VAGFDGLFLQAILSSSLGAPFDGELDDGLDDWVIVRIWGIVRICVISSI